MRDARFKKGLRLLLALGALGLFAAACDNTETSLLRAHKAANRNELVGGPVAYADTGDFVLENDKVRVAILGTERSWGPGIYGGSLVDADIRRTDSRYPSGSGRDRFSEIFPFANLLVPAPIGTQVSVFKDGSDGQEATIRVEGIGMFLFDGLSILRTYNPILAGMFSTPTTDVHFRTDYTLHPGESFVRMKTWVIGDPLPDDTRVCKSLTDLGCQPCDDITQLAHKLDANGCETCECSDTLPMKYADGSESVFGIILGDYAASATPPTKRAGIGAGDFVFFGNENDIFVPGHGFDEEKPVWDGLFANVDLFAHPLAFDFVSAAGGDVSYAYFSKKANPGDSDPKVLVPVFTSAATAFLTASLNCAWDNSDACQSSRVYEFERFLAVGAGDIASVSDIVFSGRGTTVGTVKGYVRWRDSGAAATNATVFVLTDPDPTHKWLTADEVIDANRALDPLKSSPGVVNDIDADVGLDPVEDGTFSATLPPGHYVFVAMDENKVVLGAPIQLEVKAGQTSIIAPSLPTPAIVHIQATDGSGSAIPAKATIVELDANGKPLWRDGGRRPYFGQGRLGIGVQYLGFAMDGKFDIPLQGGTIPLDCPADLLTPAEVTACSGAPVQYQVVVSHGPEYGILNTTIGLKAGDNKPVQATLTHEVNTQGWVATDFHLHAEPSFDSGMPLATRVATVAAEGLDYVAATDHDVLTNYQPFIDNFGIQAWLKAVVGSEVTTMEIGHYIGFPLKYDALDVPSHGSVDWYCDQSQQIINAILAKSGFTSDEKPSTIVPHPRDGFFGWAAQGGVIGYTLQRALSTLENGNPTLRTMGCDFDAIEMYNGKRFDLVHTPTTGEVMIFERCIWRIDHAKTLDDLNNACPELTDPKHSDRGLTLSPLTTCPGDEATTDFLTCQHRFRIAAAQFVSSEILIRTPAEADAWMAESAKPNGSQTVSDLSALCTFKDPDIISDPTAKAAALDVINQPLDLSLAPTEQDLPCGRWDGVMEDWSNFMEHGLIRSIVGGSDSHGFKGEPGTPRTWIRSSTDDVLSISPSEITKNLRAGQTIASYGPFVELTVNGAQPGDTVTAKGQSQVSVHVRIQTASWFAVDRYEVYVNGHVVRAVDLPLGGTHTAAGIVDVDETFSVDLPAGRDSWLAVNTLGTSEGTLMRPVELDVPFGELQLPRIAAMAFANLPSPMIQAIFPTPVRVPDYFPIYPMATTGAVFIDTDGNNRYDAPLPYPAFCGAPCDASTGKISAGGSIGKGCDSIESDYVCLKPEGMCGIDVPGVCSIYQAETQSALHGTFSLQGPK